MTDDIVSSAQAEREKVIVKQNNIPLIVAALFIGIMIGALGVGVMFAPELMIGTQSNTQQFNLSDTDKNFVVNALIATGFCEKMGLQSSLYVNYNPDTNTPYDVPICVQRTA